MAANDDDRDYDDEGILGLLQYTIRKVMAFARDLRIGTVVKQHM